MTSPARSQTFAVAEFCQRGRRDLLRPEGSDRRGPGGSYGSARGERVNIKQLETFLVIVRSGSFSAAAERFERDAVHGLGADTRSRGGSWGHSI